MTTTPRPTRKAVEDQLWRQTRHSRDPLRLQGPLLAELPDTVDEEDLAFIRWMAGWDGHTVAGLIRLAMLIRQPTIPTAACGHPAPVVEVNADHWLGRMAFHLDLLLRQLQSADEMANADHRSVAVGMTRCCLEDYQALREQQAEAARLAKGPCQVCELAARGVA